LGSALIWIGVFAWVPYIYLRVTGQGISPFLFLPFHLIGVIGGSRLRSNAHQELGVSKTRKNIFHLIGYVMIWAGVSVWLPYFYMKLIFHAPAAVLNYLPYHLAGVLGGLLMLGISLWIDRRATF